MADGSKRKSIYSVLSVDLKSDGSIEANVAGSYGDKDDAVKACADYIIERLGIRDDVRYALYNDVNHRKTLRKALKDRSGVSYARLKTMFRYGTSEGWALPKNVKDALWSYLRWNIECTGVYDIGTEMESDIGCNEFLFEIQSNPIC